MCGVLHCFGVEIRAEFLAFALEDDLLEVLDLCGLFHVLVVFLVFVEYALLALLVGNTFPALKAFILTSKLLEVHVYAAVLSAAHYCRLNQIWQLFQLTYSLLQLLMCPRRIIYLRHIG